MLHEDLVIDHIHSDIQCMHINNFALLALLRLLANRRIRNPSHDGAQLTSGVVTHDRHDHVLSCEADTPVFWRRRSRSVDENSSGWRARHVPGQFDSLLGEKKIVKWESWVVNAHRNPRR